MTTAQTAGREMSDFSAMLFEKRLANLRQAQIELISADEHDQDENDRLVDMEWGAKERVLGTPAPNIRALLAKFEILLEPDEAWDAEIVASVLAEAMQFAGVDRSPTFVPEVWLHYFQWYGGQVSKRDGKVWLTAPLEGFAANRIGELTPVQRAAVQDHLEHVLEG